jgi:chromosome partitioning protein
VRVQPDRRLDQGLALLEQAGERFDVVLIDCPPAFDMLTVNALITCDLMLVPTKADHLDAAGLAVLDEVEAEIRVGNTDFAVMVVVAMFDNRTVHS